MKILNTENRMELDKKENNENSKRNLLYKSSWLQNVYMAAYQTINVNIMYIIILGNFVRNW
jgi:hypothetical protein